ncbi:hypothetical protein LguiB_014093 [Lonicera macranthoides]
MLFLGLLSMIINLPYWIECRSMPTDVIVAKDGTGNFSLVKDAIEAAPNYSSTRFYIRIKEGSYIEHIIIGKEKRNIAIIGDGIGKTIISGNRSRGSGIGTDLTATVGVYGNGFFAQGVTFRNVAGPLKHQAVALTSEADRCAFYQCSFEGFQDTLYAKMGIQFFRECEIYGTVDFIFGKASVVFQNCIIYARTPLPGQSNTITAQGREAPEGIDGTIIHNCTITATEDLRQQGSKVKTYLGRPWGTYSRTVIMQSFLDNIIDPHGWLNWTGHTLDRPYYPEFDNRGPGASTNARVKWALVINRATAAEYSVRNFIQGHKWIPTIGIPVHLDLL